MLNLRRRSERPLQYLVDREKVSKVYVICTGRQKLEPPDEGSGAVYFEPRVGLAQRAQQLVHDRARVGLGKGAVLHEMLEELPTLDELRQSILAQNRSLVEVSDTSLMALDGPLIEALRRWYRLTPSSMTRSTVASCTPVIRCWETSCSMICAHFWIMK